MQGHRDVGQRVTERGDDGDHHGPPGVPAQAGQTGHDRAGALDRHDRAPDRGAAEIGVALHRPEQHPGRPGDQVEEGELHGVRPQPGPGPEVRPALGHVGAERGASWGFRSGRSRCSAPGAGQLEQTEGQHAHGVSRRVHRHHHGRTGQGDQHPAQRWAGDPGRRAGQAIQRVRVGKLVPRRDLDRQGTQGRGEERGTHAPEPGEQDEQPKRRPPDGQCDRERRLGRAAEYVRADHHPAPPEPVGDRPCQRQQQDLGDDGGGKHQAQPGRADPAVQHRPGDRHGGHRRAEQGGHEADVEAPEVPLRQDPDPAPQPLCPHGTGS